MDKKVLTAEKILGNAEQLIYYIHRGKLDIVTYPDFRAESKPYDLNILKKKFLL